MSRRPTFVGIAAAALVLTLGFFPVPAAAANAANAPQKVCAAGPIGYPGGARGHPDQAGSVTWSSAGFAMLVPGSAGDGSRIVSWGKSSDGGDGDWDSDDSKTTKYDPKGPGYASVIANVGAFAAVNRNGCTRSWGHSHYGGSDHEFQGDGHGCGALHSAGSGHSDPIVNNFTTVFSGPDDFVGIRRDGSMFTWGYNTDSTPTGTGFVAVWTAPLGGFVALHQNGSLHGWAADGYADLYEPPAGNDFVAVYSAGNPDHQSAFAALTANGTIHTWGLHNFDSDNGPWFDNPPGSGFVAIYSNRGNFGGANGAFAALHKDRTIHVWGYGEDGGNPEDAPAGGGFRAIYSTSTRFAALHSDGSIHSWGGQNPYDWAVTNAPQWEVPWGKHGVPNGTGFVAIFSTDHSFVALHESGTIHGYGDVPTGSGFVAIYSNAVAFAALHRDGSIRTWGAFDFENKHGHPGAWTFADAETGCGSVGGPVGGGFVAIHSSQCAFAAIHRDGSVHTWGHAEKGGRLPWAHLRDRPIAFAPSYDGSSAALCADGRAPVALYDTPVTADASGTSEGLANGCGPTNSPLALPSEGQGKLYEQITAVLEDTAELKSNTLASLEDTAHIKNQDVLVRNSTATIKAQITTLTSQSATVLGAVGILVEDQANLKGQVESVVEVSADLKGKVEAVAEDTASIKEDTADLKGTVGAVVEDTSELKAQLAALQSKVVELPPLLEACTAARRARSEAHDQQQADGGQNSGSAGMIAGIVIGLLAGVGLTVFAMGRRLDGAAKSPAAKASNILAFNNEAYEGGASGGTRNDAMYADMPGGLDNDAAYADVMEATVATARSSADDGSYLDVAEAPNDNGSYLDVAEAPDVVDSGSDDDFEC